MEWCTSLTDKLDNVFAQNCNGNTKILKIDLGKLSNKSIISECQINSYPIIRLYKYSKTFQEIYCTYPNIEEIILSFLNRISIIFENYMRLRILKMTVKLLKQSRNLKYSFYIYYFYKKFYLIILTHI